MRSQSNRQSSFFYRAHSRFTSPPVETWISRLRTRQSFASTAGCGAGGVLSRQRLFQLLDALMAKPIIWIGGAPGVGKTTLVASYIAARGIRSIWFRASRIDRQELQDRLTSLRAPDMLILDGYESVRLDSPLHETLLELPRGTPRESHLVLIGRGEPPALYAPLIANGMLAALPGCELLITEDEARLLSSGLSVDDSSIRALHQQCGGWATGIALGLQYVQQHRCNGEL